MTGQKPSIISIQFEEIASQDLVKPNFRHRLAILSLSIFKEKHNHFVAGIHYSAYDGLIQVDDQRIHPSFMVINPEFRGESTSMPFLQTSISYDEFATNLGVDLSNFSFTDRLQGL